VDHDDADGRRAAVRRAIASLSELQSRSCECPAGTDPFDWSADVLDELARLVCAVAPTVEHLTGRANDLLDARADDLATAIVAHRNALMAPDHDVA
jgi:hypothetical protein